MLTPLFYMSTLRGDQNFVRHFMMGKEFNFFQRQVEGIYSYKAEWLEDRITANPKIIYFHGRPWITEVKEPFVAMHWR